MDYRVTPIGIISSPFKEKFGIPRQPGLAPGIRATLELLPPYDRAEALTGLEGFSHLWLIFLFHDLSRQAWQPTVRPPRLGGNRRMGVFASRSPFRPNPIGLSLVRLEEVACEKGAARLHLSGVDLLDRTPVLDIKPYIPYVESIPDASAGYAETPPESCLKVLFSETVERALEERPDGEALRGVIVDLLKSDPRPAYSGSGEGRVHGVRLFDFDLRWRVRGGEAEVLELVPI